MEALWNSLTTLNKGFAVAALFFAVLFLWQIVGMLLGIDGHGHGDAGDGAMAHHGACDDPGHHGGGEIAFTLVTIRSVLAFATLFTWAGTLYLMHGTSLGLAFVYSFLWGSAAMLLVSYAVYKMVQMQEIGTADLWSAIGEKGTVYLNIPEGGTGQVRVKVSGVVSCVKAASSDGKPLPAGTVVKVTSILDGRTIEVSTIEDP
jgi:membrane protein implicated in regulation of membrane protease activity